jgi:competence protein ComEA
MKDWKGILFGTFLGLAFSAVFVMVALPPRGEPIAIPPTATPSPIIVYVSGAVNSPGLVSITPDDRVSNAIDKAGGFTSDADQTTINMAAKLNDGDKIFVPSKSEQATKAAVDATLATMGTKSKNTETPVPSYPININTASQQELENLPNIGPSKAADIIEYRNLHGPFLKIDDIQNVPNIGPTIFDKIRDLITISG